MEVNFVDELAHESRESILGSQCSPLPRELRSTELVSAGDEQEVKTCGHFSIRGYVSGIRTRDAKICWPFFMFHNRKSNEYASSLPPLHVTKFRRWNCENCMHEINTPAEVVANGALPKSQNDEPKADEKILLPANQHLFEEEIRDEELDEVDSSINVSKDKCLLSVCGAKKEKVSTITDPTAEGFRVPKANNDTFEVIQNQSPTSVITKCTECQMGIRGEINVRQSISTLRTAHDVVVPDLLCTKPNEIELVHKIADSVMADGPTLMRSTGALSGQKQFNDPSRHVFDIGSTGLDESDNESSENTIDLAQFTVQFQNHAGKLLTSDRRMHHKKVRKVRLLDDIIRSEELCMMSKSVHNSNGNAKPAPSLEDIDSRSDASKGKHHLDHRSHLSGHETEVEPVKSKIMYKPLENKDQGPSLMYWLKRVNKKPMTHKGDAENKQINTAVVHSKSVATAFAGKGLDLIRESSNSKGNWVKKVVYRKQNEMPRVMNGKGVTAAEGAPSQNVHAKTKPSELEGIRTTGKSRHYSPKIHNRGYKMITMTKKKYIESRVEETRLLKDSFGKHDQAITTAFQGQKSVNKKRRTTRLYRKVASDDIPMDIVELLAKNQHERHIPDSKAGFSSIFSFPHKPENMKDHNALSVAGKDGKIVLGNGNIDKRTITIRSPINTKQTIDMDSEQEDLFNASMRHAAVPQYRSQPMSCVESPKFNPNNICFAKGYSSNRVEVQTSGSCHTDQAISIQNSHGNVHGWSSVPGTCSPSGFNPRNIDADSNHMNVLYNDPPSQSKQKILAYVTDNLKVGNHDDTKLLRSKRQAESSLSASFAKIGNTLSPNDVMPAMHLLKLMDSATMSVPSLHKSLDINHVGNIQEINLYANYLPANDHTVRGQHHENSCKAFRPLPVVGILGSLLQKEITTHSSNCGTQSGFRIGDSNVSRGETNGIKSSECPHTIICTRDMESKSRVSRDEDIQKLFSAVDYVRSPGFSLPVDNAFQVDINSEKGAVQHLKGRNEMEICVVNRNPADFTILNGDNEYMVASKVPRPKCVTPSRNLYRPNHINKRQKLTRSTPSKGLLRS